VSLDGAWRYVEVFAESVLSHPRSRLDYVPLARQLMPFGWNNVYYPPESKNNGTSRRVRRVVQRRRDWNFPNEKERS